LQRKILCYGHISHEIQALQHFGLKVDQNREAGIQLTSSERCSLIGNVASLNDQGIALAGSNECVLTNNRAEANQRDGISLVQLLIGELQDNDAIGNAQGIFVQSSKNY